MKWHCLRQMYLLFISSVCFFFPSVIPFLSGLWEPPVWISSAIVSVATLTTDGVRIISLWSALSVVGILILKVLTFHICASIFRFATHTNLHEVTSIAVLSSLADFQKATTLKTIVKFVFLCGYVTVA